MSDDAWWFGAPMLLPAWAPFPEPIFVWSFRAALTLTWAGWAGLVVLAATRPGAVDGRLRLALITPILVAALFPPVLAQDVLGYVAYGRLPAAHGLNPYLHGREALLAAGDPAGTFLVWNTPLPYGPLWVTMAATLAALGAFGGFYAEVLAHKAVAAAALLAAGAAGMRLVERHSPGWGRATFVTIVLNPLLLVEGAGAGHNDLLMMALLLWAALFSAQGRWRAGALTLGLSVAVKPVALAVLPLLVHEHWIRSRPTRPWGESLALVAVTLAPSVLLSTLYGGPSVLVHSVVTRAAANPRNGIPLIAGAALASAALSLWYVNDGVKRRMPVAWLTAWVPMALVLALVVSPVSFPWYLTWAILPTLTVWRTPAVAPIAVTSALAMRLMWQYTVQ